VIAVDSTVWIDFFRGQVTRETMVLRSLMGQGVILVGDLVLAEVLQGFPDEPQAEAGRRTLERFAVEPMIGPAIAVAAARNYRALRGKGITIRRTIDLLIGTFCIEHGHVLLHNDRDFEPMRLHLGLQVL
jgi:predicted nucleic acid-binding protein